MILKKITSTIWGRIGGTVSDQEDLQNEFDNKSNVGHTHEEGGGGEEVNHNGLSNLGYSVSGHTGFQAALVFDAMLGAYLING